MNRWLSSGGLLTGNVLVQTSDFFLSPETYSGHVGLLVLSLAGLLLSLCHLARATSAGLTEQDETFAV